jgi:hypothetical protein
MGDLNIIQSPNDKKSYKYLKLSNGIAVLLIHDPAVAEALATAEVSRATCKMASSWQQQHSSRATAGEEGIQIKQRLPRATFISLVYSPLVAAWAWGYAALYCLANVALVVADTQPVAQVTHSRSHRHACFHDAPQLSTG